MTCRLGDYLIYGELLNTSPYSTHGRLVLRSDEEGGESVVLVELTGNCDSDLHGKFFRFWPKEDSPDCDVFRTKDQPRVHFQQIGPTGTMTAQGWIKTLPCGVEEFYRRAKLGEPPPTRWERRLYLEWYSQNGRVLIELAGAHVEENVRMPASDDDEGDWREIPNLALPPDLDTNPKDAQLGIQIVEPDPEEERAEFDHPENHLQDHVSAESGDIIDELKLMDACLDHGIPENLETIIPDVKTLPPPELYDDKQIETLLKIALARLAFYGIAVHLCKHYTPRDCYKLLLREILPNSEIYPELFGTGWVRGYMTGEYCEACEAEATADYEKHKPKGEDAP